MADFIVPKGKEFQFTLKIIEKDSFLPQDVTTLDTNNSSVTFRELSTMICVPAVIGSPITMTPLPDDISVTPLTYLLGRVKVTLPAAYTDQLVFERGDKVDGYYLKPTYEAIISLVFTDTNIPSRTVIIDSVYVIPASC